MRKNLISKILGGFFLGLTILNSSSALAVDSTKFKLNSTPDLENNCINLSWDNEKNNYSYMLFSKENGLENTYYQSIPCKDTIRVLNIYPGRDKDGNPVGNQLANWMSEPALELVNTETSDTELTLKKIKDRHPGESEEYTDETLKYNYVKDNNGNFITNGRGLIQPDPNNKNKPYKNNDGYVYAKDEKGVENKGLIFIEEKDIDEFNSLSDTGINYLLDNNNNYKYDVIYQGGYDSNNKKELSQSSKKYLNDFISTGRGYLAGHDTSITDSQFLRQSLISLGEYKDKWCGDTTVKIHKKGLLTNYPWKIGEVGTTLLVPMSHTDQFAKGDVWITYNHSNWLQCGKQIDSFNGASGTNNFYLTTFGNTALIQAGHSNGKATPDEEKILANTLFYLAQLTTNTNWSDHKGQDLAKPNTPNVKNINKKDETIEISLNPTTDNGSTYNYYLKAINQNTNEVITTENTPTKATITTGIDKYLVVADKNSNTDIASKTVQNLNSKKDIFDGIDISTETNFNYSGTFNNDFYVHVAAIDKAGNISETSTYNYISPTLKLEASPTEYTNGSVNITETANNPEFGISKISYEGKELPTQAIDDKTLSSTYEATQNGDYTFTATDNKGNEISKTITIDNIRPIILNVEPNYDNTDFKNDVSVDVILNNITNISEDNIIIKYDATKLFYSGVDTNGNYFDLKSRNTKPGEITFSLKSKEVNEALLTNKLLTLHFTGIASGNATISVDSNSKLYDSHHIVRDLLPIECGSAEILVSDNN